ncbi:restriction endonuclease subunit S [Ideonella dechloratans]|uniref:restriction endonuclease subunit S n=1 Tax=Ideonella dechloratans TaxID=36863 RepID=UPI0035B3684F
MIIGRKGAYRGVHYSRRPFFVIDTAFYLKPKVTLDARWAYYQLLTANINGMDSGSAIPSTSRDEFYKLPVTLPPIGEQVRIADSLMLLDDRIDLLRQTNATLESIAQALFKSWFIDFDPVRAKAEGREPEGMDAATAALFPAEFEESALGLIPKGWCVGTFGDLAVLGKGSVNPMDFPTSTFEHYSLPAFDAGQLPILEEGASIKSNKTRVPRRAVLQSKLNPHIPRVWLIGDADKQAVCSTEFLPWMAREGASPALIYCTLRSPSFEAQVRTLVTGTSNSHQRVKPDQVASLAVVAAPPVVASAFAALVEPMLGKVLANRLKAQNLAELRDALLPRLISGKLRLPEAKVQLEDALA